MIRLICLKDCISLLNNYVSKLFLQSSFATTLVAKYIFSYYFLRFLFKILCIRVIKSKIKFIIIYQTTKTLFRCHFRNWNYFFQFSIPFTYSDSLPLSLPLAHIRINSLNRKLLEYKTNFRCLYLHNQPDRQDNQPTSQSAMQPKN